MAGQLEKPAVEWRARVLILVCAGVLVLPLAVRGASCGHDFDFHLESWIDVAQSWRAGVFYPHWMTSANYGAGEPRFVFYPPVSWMLGAALGMVFGWHAAPVLLTWIALAGAGVSMYQLAREWSGITVSLVAAGIYFANPYAMFVAYERTAYGELLAAVWLPLILLFGMGAGRSICGLALAVAGVWLTNAPAAVMACYTLGFLVLLECVQSRHWRPLLTAAAGIALGCGLAAFYILPAAYERRWVEIERAIAPGMRVEDSFLFGHTGEPFHDQVLRTASWIAVFFIVTMAITTFVGLRERQHRSLVQRLGALAALIFFLLLPWSDFLWRIAPEMLFLQFPWRWLMVCELLLAILVGLATARPLDRRPSLGWRRAISASAVMTLAMTVLGGLLFWQPCDEEDNITAQLATFHSGDGFEGTDEYAPRGADNSIIQRGLPQVRLLDSPDADEAAGSSDPAFPNQQYTASAGVLPIKGTIDSWLPERKSVEVRAPSGGFAVLKVMDYPAWLVRVNGKQVGDRPRREDGLLIVPLGSGDSHIEVSYRATWDVLSGRLLSIACACVWIAVARRQRHAIRLS